MTFDAKNAVHEVSEAAPNVLCGLGIYIREMNHLNSLTDYEVSSEPLMAVLYICTGF